MYFLDPDPSTLNNWGCRPLPTWPEVYDGRSLLTRVLPPELILRRKKLSLSRFQWCSVMGSPQSVSWETTHRHLWVFKHLSGLLKAARLLQTLPLQISHFQLLKPAGVVAASPDQDTVGLLRLQKDCQTQREESSSAYIGLLNIT